MPAHRAQADRSRQRLGATSVALLLLLNSVAGAMAQSLEEQLGAAETMAREGRLREAVTALEELRDTAATSGDREGLAVVMGALGSAQLGLGETTKAARAMQESLALARERQLTLVEARTRLNQGNLALHQREPRLALEAYAAAVELAELAGAPVLVARARLNAARVHLDDANYMATRAELNRAEEALARVAEPRSSILDRLVLGQLRLTLLAHDPGQLEPAYRILETARTDARQNGDRRSEAWALLYLGELYARERRTVDALALWREGTLRAQGSDAADSVWRLERSIGHALAARGRRPEAIRAYQRAVAALATIRLDLPTFDPATGRSLFREIVGPVFLELTDLLLQEAAAMGEAPAGQDLLREARRQVEILKAVELADYFRDDCVADLQARVRPIDAPAGAAAVVYPILLPDRIELLLSLPNGRILQSRLPVSAERLTNVVREFRFQLENRANRRFRRPARTLYDWLIRPLRPTLEATGIDTLIVLPDGPLRTIPFAALEDGSRFLVERFALATAPGLSLLDPRPLGETRLNILLTGLTEGVQGFPPLPHVRQEIETIREAYGGTVLLDEAFVAPAFERSLERAPFTVVHIASHGKFAADPKDSFLLTYDGRLDMEELERLLEGVRFRDQPVELLTLSACRTAAGDDRAALGLAGIAVKAGARSALASLWFINDESSAVLVGAFYEALARPGTSKAEALRDAQRRLLADRRYSHPAYWAPFLIIGNWL